MKTIKFIKTVEVPDEDIFHIQDKFDELFEKINEYNNSWDNPVIYHFNYCNVYATRVDTDDDMDSEYSIIIMNVGIFDDYTEEYTSFIQFRILSKEEGLFHEHLGCYMKLYSCLYTNGLKEFNDGCH